MNKENTYLLTYKL